ILNSGDLLEVELLVTSKNDYEYLLIEDFKAATCEAVDNRSVTQRMTSVCAMPQQRRWVLRALHLSL
ncbi:MAG: hypothetical protein PHS50_07960, partial [Kiritimatiellae bacterium]|nr:hypothetical protein [Kiritimatiellia bacterium]